MDAPRLLSLSVSSERFLALGAGDVDATDGSERRSVRKNVLARGLARRYGDQKGRTEALLAKVSRQKKQLAILVEYNRRKEAEAERGGAREQPSDFATVAPQRGPSHFPRTTSLRLLADNQETEKEELEDKLHSPTEDDLARFSALTANFAPAEASPVSRSPLTHLTNAREPTAPPTAKSAARAREELAGGSSLDKSSAQVLCELKVTKEIVVREQTLKQLRELVPVLDTLASELSAIAARREAASALLAAASSSPIREKRGSSSMTVAPLSIRRPESGHASAAAIEREMKELVTQFGELADTARHRVRQFATLLETLREASMSAADAIIEWRRFRQRRCRFTNFQPLYRFPWRRLRVANYLTHMAGDVDFLFETAALQLAVGSDLARNALLLPRSQLELLGFAESSFVSTTFLTERRDRSDTGAGVSSPTAPKHKRGQHYQVLLEAMAAKAGAEPALLATVDNERALRCLEILRHERELEGDEAEKDEAEQRRVSEAYNPFATIKAAGGVEESLTQVLSAQSPLAAALSQQLRSRQEDTSRAILSPALPEREADGVCSPLRLPRDTSERLRVNSRRLVQLLERRKEQSSSTPECEARSVQAWGMKNKLPGQVVMRKLTVRRQQNQRARKIQLQFRVHRLRREMLQGLARFVATTRQSAAHIQRIYRGYCAKKRYDIAKMLLEVERRRVAAGRTILHAYRRYKRRLRHRRSMTVESFAQAQLFCIQYQKLQEESDEDAVDRYRRVGEERRRQRVVLLQRRRLEQLELEQRRVESATRIQACVRAHLAMRELALLRKERKTHVTAMCIMSLQSNVRRFLRRQEERRQRFRRDLERVNRSAVRIQSIYRGYNSRASLVVQLEDDAVRGGQAIGRFGGHSGDDSEDNDDESEDSEDNNEPKHGGDDGRLPPLAVSTSAARLSRPPMATSQRSVVASDDNPMVAMLSAATEYATRLPPLRAATATVVAAPLPPSQPARRPSVSGATTNTTRVELKLKEPVIGDDFAGGSRRESSSERRRSSVDRAARASSAVGR